jgi:hypothetical protein
MELIRGALGLGQFSVFRIWAYVFFNKKNWAYKSIIWSKSQIGKETGPALIM